jgi:UDP-N-acetylglucosamine:LPS N-acetylglucosamine transferase
MGEGGHSKECLRLIDLMGDEDYRYSYILVADDEVTASKVRVPGPIYRVIRPGCKKTNPITDSVKYPICAAQALRSLLRARPDAVLTTGPAVAVPVCLMARLLGVSVVFVETGSRIHGLSSTGRFMRRIASLYFVQWEDLRPLVPRAIFAGRLC